MCRSSAIADRAGRNHESPAPSRALTRCFISAAALLVNVIARMDGAGIPRLTRYATRRVMTRVFYRCLRRRRSAADHPHASRPHAAGRSSQRAVDRAINHDPVRIAPIAVEFQTGRFTKRTRINCLRTRRRVDHRMAVRCCAAFNCESSSCIVRGSWRSQKRGRSINRVLAGRRTLMFCRVFHRLDILKALHAAKNRSRDPHLQSHQRARSAAYSIDLPTHDHLDDGQRILRYAQA